MLGKKRNFVKLTHTHHYIIYTLAWIFLAIVPILFILCLRSLWFDYLAWNRTLQGFYYGFNREIWACFTLLAIFLCEFVKPTSNNLRKWLITKCMEYIVLKIIYFISTTFSCSGLVFAAQI